MYLPRRFAETDLAALDALFARDAFVTLVTIDAVGQAAASHLPVLYARAGDSVSIEGHWARANPQAQHGGTALIICHGPHAYISPSWYAVPEDRVPTWNYAVAHLRGRLDVINAIEPKRRIVSALAAHYESALGSSWQPAHGHPDFEPELEAIIGFRIEVESIAMKFKLNQNYAVADVEGAIRGLRAEGRPLGREVADLMHARLNQRAPGDGQ